jgi:hypothetical protein
MKRDLTKSITPRWLDLPKHEHPWGNLCFGQPQQPFPFSIERVYYIYGIPAEARRGGHAHWENREAVFCLQGACTLWLYSPEGKEKTYRLGHPSRGVFIPELWWVEFGEYTDSSLILVVASSPYRESDYIRNPEDFFLAAPFPDPVYRPRC